MENKEPEPSLQPTKLSQIEIVRTGYYQVLIENAKINPKKQSDLFLIMNVPTRATSPDHRKIYYRCVRLPFFLTDHRKQSEFLLI
uniref:Uncharacterized protein n=1 Tax=Solanum tuberosum TaxID=4113 RepID=M1BEX3_SOLTU